MIEKIYNFIRKWLRYGSEAWNMKEKIKVNYELQKQFFLEW